jgi:hypothetical protein
MNLDFDMTEFNAIADLMQRRADHLVPICVDDGRTRAEAYASAGGRHRDPATRRFHATLTHRNRPHMRRATGPQIASMTEKVFYHHFIDWWNQSW